MKVSSRASIDFREVRVHFAARAIAHYVSSGKRQDWISPIFVDALWADYYWGWKEDGAWHQNKTFISACFKKWPQETLSQFYAWPIVRLLERHNLDELNKIALILRDTYGFEC